MSELIAPIPRQSPEKNLDKRTLRALAGQNGKGIGEGVITMNQRAQETLAQNGKKGHGLTNPEFDENRHLIEKDTIFREGLNLSMYNYASDSFTSLLSRLYGLDEGDLPNGYEVQKSMLSTNGEKSIKVLEDGTADEIVLFRSNDRERLEAEYPRSSLDKNFWQFLKDTYGLRDDQETERFYHENITIASRFVGWYIDRALPQSKNSLSQRNEIDPPPTNPSKLLHILASENVSSELKFETQRFLVNFLLACEFTSREWDISLRQKLNQLNELIDQRLLGGMIGDAELREIVALHNAETGRVINLVDGDPSRSHQEGVMKVHRLKMRPLLEPLHVENKNKKFKTTPEEKTKHETDRVYIDFDEKSIFSAMAKSLHKASKRNGNGQNGEIIPVRDAVDLCRLVIVVADSDKKKRDNLVQRFSEMLKNPTSEEFVGKNKYVRNDDRTSGKGNSKRFDYRRLQVMYEDAKIPVEIQIFDMQNYLNSQLSIGKKTKDGYNGEAHELYELKKFGEIVQLLFPEETYGNLKKDIMEEQSNRAASILRRTVSTHSS